MPVCASTTANKNAMVACEDLPPHSGLVQRLPLDQLKIDQSFVRNIVTDPGDAAIAKTVIALADSMGLSVIAEGVEIEAQRNLLTDLGCHNYQGYLFSRPLPVHEFEAFVAQA